MMITLDLINQRIAELEVLHSEYQRKTDMLQGSIEECQKIRGFISASQEVKAIEPKETMINSDLPNKAH